MSEAVDLVAETSPRMLKNRTALAERVFDAVAEPGYGEFDGIVPATSEAFGQEGLEHLKRITQAWAEAPPTEQELEQYRGYGLMSFAENSVCRNKKVTRSIILANVADAQGDVDAYMARYSAEQLAYGTVAADLARRLLDAGRADEAFDIVIRFRATENGKAFRMLRYHLDEDYGECLERQGKTEDLKAHPWSTFEQTLSAPCLGKYLKLLPDFNDLEAQEAAMDFAETYAHPGAAISFLDDRPSHDRAANVVLARIDELDGNSYHTLARAADALESGHPLTATLVRRAMVLDTLLGGKSKR